MSNKQLMSSCPTWTGTTLCNANLMPSVAIVICFAISRDFIAIFV